MPKACQPRCVCGKFVEVHGWPCNGCELAEYDFAVSVEEFGRNKKGPVTPSDIRWFLSKPANAKGVAIVLKNLVKRRGER